jgi:hypothetical protein
MSTLSQVLKHYARPALKGAVIGGGIGATIGGISEYNRPKKKRRVIREALRSGLWGAGLGAAAGLYARSRLDASDPWSGTSWEWKRQGPRPGSTGGGYEGYRRTHQQTGGGGFRRPQVHPIWDKVPEQVRNKIRGVAAHAKDPANTPENRKNAREILEKLRGKHGIGISADDLIKNAGFYAGLTVAFSK